MDFFEVISKRRSVRRYTKTQVPDQVVQRALEAALLAPNSSNMQAWEFYWVKSPAKKLALAEACLGQGAARTANHLIVAVSRVDTWKRNRELLLKEMEKSGPLTKLVTDYYNKIVPIMYQQDPFGILGFLKWILLNAYGIFRPIARGPFFRAPLFELVTKSAALACENFMLAITAQGFGTCPMEGFDEKRVKKLLQLNRHCHVVMVISVGEIDPAGIYGPQLRLNQNLFIKEV